MGNIRGECFRRTVVAGGAGHALRHGLPLHGAAATHPDILQATYRDVWQRANPLLHSRRLKLLQQLHPSRLCHPAGAGHCAEPPGSNGTPSRRLSHCAARPADRSPLLLRRAHPGRSTAPPVGERRVELRVGEVDGITAPPETNGGRENGL